MLTRGVKYMFKTGENVLSFEPDSTKAKVLYDAKVLDCSVTRDRHSRRKPAYLIHFQGWNNSWDRVVSESFLLKNTEENRRLMHKLSSISTKVKRNSVRIRKIDRALHKHFRRRSHNGGQRSGKSENHSATDSDDDDGDDDDDDIHSKVSSRVNDDHDNDDGNRNDDDNDDDDSSSSSSSEKDFEQDDKARNSGSSDSEPEEIIDDGPVKLELPDNVKRKLMQDYDLINKQKKLLLLPASQSVVHVLENYVRTFAVSVLCESVEHQKSHRLRSQQHQGPEKSIELCKEVVDGLRIIFDSVLPLILLYERERKQYQYVMSTHRSQIHDLLQSNEPTLVDSACDSGSDEVSFRVPPHPSLPVLRRQTSTHEINNQSERRVTRLSSSGHASMDLPPPIIAKHAPSTSESECLTGSNSSNKSRRSSSAHHSSARSSHHHSIKERRQSEHQQPVESCDGEETTGCRKAGRSSAAAPPSRSRLGSLSSVASSSGAGNPYVEHQDMMKDNILKDISSWKIIPESVYAEGSDYKLQPSLIYGTHHLVRLLTELPGILTKMQIPTERRRHLVRHLEKLIEYIGNHCDELLDMTSAYIKADQLHLTSSRGNRSDY